MIRRSVSALVPAPFLLLLLLLLSFPSFAADSTIRLRYTGWKCAACAAKVEKAARATRGVTRATATLDVVTITYDDAKTGPATLASSLSLSPTLSREGFTFTPLVTGTSG